MPATAPRAARKRRNHYHHGDLRRALIQDAVRIIQADGVAGLTLRAVGRHLGVSRTALYRHFADKSALLAAVATEGFRAFRQELAAALGAPGDGADGLEAMGRAYVRFAVTHPSHYRVMFGGFLDACAKDPDLVAEATASFRVLVEAIVEQQRTGSLRHDDPQQIARYVWAVTHGVAMLTIDGQVKGSDPDQEIRYAIGRLRRGIAA